MKKTYKFLISFLVIIPCLFLCSCFGSFLDTVSVVSIEKVLSDNLTESYLVTYSNGKTSTIDINNGDDIDINDIYQTATEKGYTGTFLEFLQEYLSFSNIDDVSLASNKALMSTVSVYSNFTVEQMYRNMFGQIQKSQSTVTSAGSGVIYKLNKTTGEAYIITNYHVVYEADAVSQISDEIYILLYGMEYEDYKMEATYVGGSMTNDIAVLKVSSDILKSADVQAVSVADSNNIIVGEKAIAVGNPEAEGISVTCGIVSTESEEIEMTAVDETTTITLRVIRVDTAINSGNSGGGLFNSSGELIGIVNAKVVDEDIENIGYAIPSNVAIRVAQNIIDNDGTLKKCTLGISISTANVNVSYNNSTNKYEIKESIKVNSVTTLSLANSIGIKNNDIIQSLIINNTEYQITRDFTLNDVLYLLRVGDKISAKVLRNSETKTLSEVTLTASNFSTIN